MKEFILDIFLLQTHAKRIIVHYIFDNRLMVKIYRSSSANFTTISLMSKNFLPPYFQTLFWHLSIYMQNLKYVFNKFHPHNMKYDINCKNE